MQKVITFAVFNCAFSSKLLFPHSTECGFDYISVYDGSSTGSRLLESFCSANTKVFHSTSRYLTVTFRSDSSVTRPGFYATYSVVGRLLKVFTWCQVRLLWHQNFLSAVSEAEGLCKNNCGYEVGSCSCSSSCEYWGKCCADYRGKLRWKINVSPLDYKASALNHFQGYKLWRQ